MDPVMFAQNIMLLIAILILGGAALAVLIGLWTIGRAVWWQVTQRRSWKRYVKSTLRADGAKLPVCSEGFCSRCGKWDKTVYAAKPGLDLCAACYDGFWRLEEPGTTPRQPSGTAA